jgi:hypothetical protein
MAQDNVEIARQAFERIANEFPHLKTRIYNKAPVDLAMDILKQEGLKFDIWLNLQDDELYLNTANFILSWYPCTNAEYVDLYIDAVCGLVSGKYRILEHRRWKWVARSELQVADGEIWKTVGRSSCALGLTIIPFGKRQEIVRNV